MSRHYSERNIQHLENRLSYNYHDHSDDEEESIQQTCSLLNMAPAYIVPRRRIPVKQQRVLRQKGAITTTNDTDIINDLTEFLLEEEREDDDDEYELGKRRRPKFILTYGACVDPQHLAKCKTLIMDISLAADNTPFQDFNILSTTIDMDLKTKEYYLKIVLPNSIDPNSARAIFDAKNKILNLHFALESEYNFPNN